MNQHDPSFFYWLLPSDWTDSTINCMFISIVFGAWCREDTWRLWSSTFATFWRSLPRWRLSWQHLDDLQDKNKWVILRLRGFDSRQLSQISMNTDIKMSWIFAISNPTMQDERLKYGVIFSTPTHLNTTFVFNDLFVTTDVVTVPNWHMQSLLNDHRARVYAISVYIYSYRIIVICLIIYIHNIQSTIWFVLIFHGQ